MEKDDSSYDRTFNKDIAFLMELQRLETISNNFAIEASHEERLRTLKRWVGALSGVLREEEKEEVHRLLMNCQPVKSMGKIYYNVESLDGLHDYLNAMNTIHKLQLTTRGTASEAAKLV